MQAVERDAGSSQQASTRCVFRTSGLARSAAPCESHPLCRPWDLCAFSGM